MKMLTIKQENKDKLFKLMAENPDLPIVPMVNGEIPEDDCGYWIGSIGHAAVDEYLIANSRVCFKSDDDMFDVLERFLSREKFDALQESESDCRPFYDALPWKKAILVYIELPD